VSTFSFLAGTPPIHMHVGDQRGLANDVAMPVNPEVGAARERRWDPDTAIQASELPNKVAILREQRLTSVCLRRELQTHG